MGLVYVHWVLFARMVFGILVILVAQIVLYLKMGVLWTHSVVVKIYDAKLVLREATRGMGHNRPWICLS